MTNNPTSNDSATFSLNTSLDRTKPSKEAERFQHLAKALVSVPKKEIDKQRKAKK